MLLRPFFQIILARNLKLESSLSVEYDTLVISSNGDFPQNIRDLKIYNELTSNSVTKIKLTQAVNRILPFYGIHIITSIDFGESSVKFIPAYVFQNSYNLVQVNLSFIPVSYTHLTLPTTERV